MINIFNFLRVFTASQSLPIVTMLILFILIIFATSYFYYVYKREKDFEDTHEKLTEDYDSILVKAHKKAEEIVTQASDKAKQLLTDTKDVKEYEQKDLDEAVQKEKEEILDSFSASINGIRNDTLSYVKKMADDTQTITQSELMSFRDSMQKNLVQMRLAETQKMSDEAKKAYDEIQAYKTKQVEKVKQILSEVIVRVSEEVIGEAITLPDHEKLVLEALERAKQEGLFDA
jgi:F0F1-type ATP synthase membrane subunit b/b'